jgi:hypothetical protein
MEHCSSFGGNLSGRMLRELFNFSVIHGLMTLSKAMDSTSPLFPMGYQGTKKSKQKALKVSGSGIDLGF